VVGLDEELGRMIQCQEERAVGVHRGASGVLALLFHEHTLGADLVLLQNQFLID
jgi:hypothetical protein